MLDLDSILKVGIRTLFKFKLDRLSLETIYTSFIRPKMEYGNILFAGCPNHLLNKLNSVEFEALSIITGAMKGTARSKLVMEYGKPLLHKRRNIQVLCQIYKIIKGEAPRYLSIILDQFLNPNTYNLRNQLLYRQPAAKTTHYSRSFFPYAIRLWNSIPASTRELDSLSTFKSKLNPPNTKSPLYYYGKRWANVHHARLRMRYSALNDDLCIRLHVLNNSNCACGYPTENVEHFIWECPLYREPHYSLIENLNNIGFVQSTQKIDTDMLLNGDPSITNIQNIERFEAFHTFLLATKRFEL
jgi:hypothetical protein